MACLSGEPRSSPAGVLCPRRETGGPPGGSGRRVAAFGVSAADQVRRARQYLAWHAHVCPPRRDHRHEPETIPPSPLTKDVFAVFSSGSGLPLRRRGPNRTTNVQRVQLLGLRPTSGSANWLITRGVPPGIDLASQSGDRRIAPPGSPVVVRPRRIQHGALTTNGQGAGASGVNSERTGRAPGRLEWTVNARDGRRGVRSEGGTWW